MEVYELSPSKSSASFDPSVFKDLAQFRVGLEQLRQRQADLTESLECERGRREALEKTLLEKQELLKVDLEGVRLDSTTQADSLSKRHDKLSGIVTGKHRSRLLEMNNDLDELRVFVKEFHADVLKSRSICRIPENDVIGLPRQAHSQQAGAEIRSILSDLSKQIEAETRIRVKEIKKLRDSLADLRSEHTELQTIAASWDGVKSQMTVNGKSSSHTADVTCLQELYGNLRIEQSKLLQDLSELRQEQSELRTIATSTAQQVKAQTAHVHAAKSVELLASEQVKLRTLVEDMERATQKAVHDCVALVEQQAGALAVAERESRQVADRQELPSLDVSVATLPNASPAHRRAPEAFYMGSPQKHSAAMSPNGRPSQMCTSLDFSTTVPIPEMAVTASLTALSPPLSATESSRPSSPPPGAGELTPTRPVLPLFEGPELRHCVSAGMIPPALPLFEGPELRHGVSAAMIPPAPVPPGGFQQQTPGQRAASVPRIANESQRQPLRPHPGLSSQANLSSASTAPPAFSGIPGPCLRSPPASARGCRPALGRSASWAGSRGAPGFPAMQMQIPAPLHALDPRWCHFIQPPNGFRPPSPW